MFSDKFFHVNNYVMDIEIFLIFSEQFFFLSIFMIMSNLYCVEIVSKYIELRIVVSKNIFYSRAGK